MFLLLSFMTSFYSSISIETKLVTHFSEYKIIMLFFLFFFIWVFFHEHSLFTRQQEKWEGIFLTLPYHFHPLHRHIDISRVITAESSPLHIACSWSQTGNLWFPSASRWPLSYAPLFTLIYAPLSTRL